jgi:N-acetylglucosaminyldiphosphoundecaprenol N-acetyl-beta-D-mannosaminyltransferase
VFAKRQRLELTVTDMLQRQASHDSVSLFGLEIDAIPMQEAVSRLRQWIALRDGLCRYVVTPNVDHLVLLRDNPLLQAAYRDASMVVADGLPLVLASRLFGKPIPERVAGSDLVPALLSAADQQQSMRVFLLGAADGVAERAARRIESAWPYVRVVGVYAPPLGFQRDESENRQILDRIAYEQPDVLVVGLGAPKQELWVHAHRPRIQASVALCAGATIDFLAGQKRRAPRWIQKIGLEWCHRMLTDPRRLVRRYARDAWVFPQLMWSEVRNNSSRQ